MEAGRSHRACAWSLAALVVAVAALPAGLALANNGSLVHATLFTGAVNVERTEDGAFACRDVGNVRLLVVGGESSTAHLTLSASDCHTFHGLYEVRWSSDAMFSLDGIVTSDDARSTGFWHEMLGLGVRNTFADADSGALVEVDLAGHVRPLPP